MPNNDRLCVAETMLLCCRAGLEKILDKVEVLYERAEGGYRRKRGFAARSTFAATASVSS